MNNQEPQTIKFYKGIKNDPILFGIRTRFIIPLFMSLLGFAIVSTLLILSLGWIGLFFVVLFFFFIYRFYKDIKKRSKNDDQYLIKKFSKPKVNIILSSKKIINE